MAAGLGLPNDLIGFSLAVVTEPWGIYFATDQGSGHCVSLAATGAAPS